jgi:hypothetical protein
MKPLGPRVVLLLIAGISASGLLIAPVGPARAKAPLAAEQARETPEAVGDRVIATSPSRQEDQTPPPSASGAGPAPRALRVCPAEDASPDCRYHGLPDALAAALPGDHVVLAPGIYEEGAIVTTPGLVLRGEPGAHFRGGAVEGKAALVVKADDVVIEGIECSGIAVRDDNGACIRIEGDGLTVRNVNFHDNQQGILSGPGGGALLVEDSLFERNGFGGRAHGVYIGPRVGTFTFRNNRVLATTGEGHGVKSRAQRTVVENNVIAGLDGRDSRAIDVPNGGDVLIRGNVLEKGPNSDNAQMIGIALEGELHEVNETRVEDNLIVFDTRPEGLIQDLARAVGLLPARGVVIATESPGGVILEGNTIVGAREIGRGDLIDRDNRTYESRRAAGLLPYPAVPEVGQ